MENDEIEFEKTLVGLSEDEQKNKRLEFKAEKGDEYREKLNIQNRILEREGFEFKDGKWDKKPIVAPEPVAQTVNLSPIDAVLIAKSDIAPEDVQEVIDFASYRKLSVPDALKNSTLKAILKDRVEERTTAAATQVKTPSRSAPRETPESMLEVASQGQLPEGDEAINRLAAARIAVKKSSKQRK